MRERALSLALVFLATRVEAQEMWFCSYQNYATPSETVTADLQIGTEEVQLCFPPGGGAHLGACVLYRVVESNDLGIVGVDSRAWEARGGFGIVLLNRMTGELVMTNTFVNRDSSRTTGKCEKK
jgi:hypothetical protein